MKLLRKSLTALFAAMFILAIGVLAAGCSKKVTLSFDTKGGPTLTAIEATPGEEVTLPEPGEYALHEFDGWYLSADYTGEAVSGKITAPDQDTTYYAKWIEAYAVTLDAAGGTLSTRTVNLRGGANLYNAVKDLVPTKEGLEFGAWFMNGVEVISTTTMPEGPVTLEARYKVEYRTEYYLQSLDRQRYEIANSRTKIKKDYVGTEVSVTSEVVTGYSFLPNYGGNETSIVLSEMKDGNVLKLYYDRESYPITYDANIPSGFYTGSIEPSEGLYESEFEVKDNVFASAGLHFAGWGRSADGPVVYLPGEIAEVDGYMTLYAIWDVALPDRMGSNDLIYVLQMDDDGVLLERGGRLFEGTRDSSNNFTFVVDDGTRVQGVAFESDFIYTQTAMAGTYHYISPYFQYFAHTNQESEIEDTIMNGITLTLDSALRGSLEATGDDATAVFGGNVHEDGFVVYDASYGMYIFCRESDGAQMLAVYFTEYEGQKYFLMNGAEANIYVNLALNGFSQLGNLDANRQLMLDGFGNMIYVFSDGYSTYSVDGYYFVEAYLTNSSGYVFLIKSVIDNTDRIFTEDGDWIEFDFYTMPYSQQYGLFVEPNATKGVYQEEDGDGTLELDGYALYVGSAMYDRDGEGSGEPLECYYATLQSNVFGILSVLAYIGEDGNQVNVTVSLDIANKTFKVLKDLDATTIYEYVSVVTHEEGDATYATIGDYALITHPGNEAELYYAENNEYKVIAKGTIDEGVAQTGGMVKIYTFTTTNKVDEKKAPESFKFIINTTAIYDSNNVVRDAFYFTEWDGDSVFKKELSGEGVGKIEVRYLGSEDNHVIGVGSLYTDPNGNVYEGSLEYDTVDEFDVELAQFVYIDYESSQYSYFNFELVTAADGTQSLAVGGTLAYFYRYNDDGSINSFVDFMAYGGVGSAEYRAKYYQNNEWVEGYIEEVRTTAIETTIFSFKTKDNNLELFKFVAVAIPVGNQYVTVYGKYNEKIDGTLNTDAGPIQSDGCIAAVFQSGYNFQGTIRIIPRTDGKLCIGFAPTSLGINITLRFLYDEGQQIWLLLDDVYGEGWRIVDEASQQVEDYFVDFDGMDDFSTRDGLATIYKGTRDPDTNEVKSVEVVGTGTYSLYQTSTVSGLLTLHKEIAGLPRSFTFRVEDYADGTTYIHDCVIKDDNSEASFADEHWNVLQLDGYGTGTWCTNDGLVTQAAYHYLNRDEHVILVMLATTDNASGYETFVYKLDYDTHTLVNCTADKEYVYFADDMSALGFTAEGTAYADGEAGLYYVDGNKIYVFGVTDEGTIETETTEISGKIGDSTLSFNNKTYTLYTGGSKEITLTGTITFEEGDSVNATIKFTLEPAAWIEFEGKLTVEEETYDVYVYNYIVEFLSSTVYKTSFGTAIYFENNYSMFTVTGFSATSGTGIFTANGNVEIKMTDTSDSSNTITRSYKGFGPYYRTEATYSGTLYYYTDDYQKDPVNFEGAIGYVVDSDNGVNRVFISFEDSNGYDELGLLFDTNGTQFRPVYAMEYVEYDNDEYVLGIGCPTDSGEGYDYVIMWTVAGDERKVLYTQDQFVAEDGMSGYYIASTELGGDADTFLTFKVDRGQLKVEAYESFVQAISKETVTYGGRALSKYFAQVFAKENVEIIAGFAMFNSEIGAYEGIAVESCEALGEGKDGFKVMLANETGWEIVFEQADGERVPDEVYENAYVAVFTSTDYVEPAPDVTIPDSIIGT